MTVSCECSASNFNIVQDLIIHINIAFHTKVKTLMTPGVMASNIENDVRSIF